MLSSRFEPLRVGWKKLDSISHILFGIYINKLEKCLEDESRVDPMLTNIVATFVLYDYNIVLWVKSHQDLGKKLTILQDFSFKKGMPNNIEKTKVVIIKSKKNTYDTFMYENSYLEEVPLLNILELTSMMSSIRITTFRLGSMEEGKVTMDFKIIVS